MPDSLRIRRTIDVVTCKDGISDAGRYLLRDLRTGYRKVEIDHDVDHRAVRKRRLDVGIGAPAEEKTRRQENECLPDSAFPSPDSVVEAVLQRQGIILFSSNSIIPSAPARFKSGMSLRTCRSSITVSMATQSLPFASEEIVGIRRAGNIPIIVSAS